MTFAYEFHCPKSDPPIRRRLMFRCVDTQPATIEEAGALNDVRQKILEFGLDGERAEFSFTCRLAQENGWPREFADRVVCEYKRFLVLLATAGHPVTPSDQVDQVWHLHLTFTRSYWDHLCGQIVGRPLHHVPTIGGIDEARKFNRWYKNTLESYQRFFGQPPPSDIWPPPNIRFGDDLHFRRVNARRHIIVRKPFRFRFRSACLLGLLGMSLLLATSTIAGSSEVATSVDTASSAEKYMIIGSIIYAEVVIALLSVRLKGKCPECGTRELRPTGRTRANEEEEQCQSCGYRYWRSRSSSASSGSGCGGCGGCGG